MTTLAKTTRLAPAPTPREIEDELQAAGMAESIIQLLPQGAGYAPHARSAGYEVQRTLPILVLFHGFSALNRATGLHCIRQALAGYDLQFCHDAEGVPYYAVRGRKGGAL